MARERLKTFGAKVTVVHAPFSRIAEVAPELGIPPADGVLADLGVSSMQLDQASEGFTCGEAGPLDMRMNAEDELTAEEIVNRWPERELADLLYREADEHDSRRIARAIVRARPIRDTAHLATAVAGVRKQWGRQRLDRKSTRLNSSHEWISYAVFCLKKKRTVPGCTHRAVTARHRLAPRNSCHTRLQHPTVGR